MVILQDVFEINKETSISFPFCVFFHELFMCNVISLQEVQQTASPGRHQTESGVRRANQGGVAQLWTGLRGNGSL